MARQDTKIAWFNSPEDYADYIQTIPHMWTYGDREFNGREMHEALNVLRTGDTQNLEKAEKLIQEMQDQELFSVGLPMPVRCVAGYYPHVPSAIAGHPKAMKRRVINDQSSINTPIRVFIETTVSAGVTHSQLISRGIATLGLVMALNIIRPVELYAISIGQPKPASGMNSNILAAGSVVQIASKPVDLQRACFILTDPAYARRIAFATMEHMKGLHYPAGYIIWAWGMEPKKGVYQDNMREALEMEPHDVLIFGGHLYDKLMLNDPIQWIRNMLAIHANKGL